jgi:hypothetical protein
MLTRDDLIDIVTERLTSSMAAGPFPLAPDHLARMGTAPPTAPQRRRLDDEMRGRGFLSEYDIRKRLTVNPQELRIPKDSIISPLAVDWLTLDRIKIIRE